MALRAVVLSEMQNTDGVSRTVSSLYDLDGNRTQITHPDGAYWQMDYDGLNRATAMREWATPIGAMEYTNRGQVK
ncbi:RHS repeat domain-containing protein [Parerythrobacter lacustris]|uniref:RHS repeat protein n=1 Tax=Parerythrobacter lacustris TaxID=2969984 RepID=A0ABT1XQ58_9SPHN|nr:RHS repeat domain-containing protein [Parerythrobacter lacustris]MCR2833041.1 RHS repeat protein [Parerythrobacter lacustris]